jgi:hypothetical protein
MRLTWNGCQLCTVDYAQWILGGVIKRWPSKQKTRDDDSYIATAAVSQFGDCV